MNQMFNYCTAQLMCAFVFAYNKIELFHFAAQIINEPPRGKTNNVVSEQV